MFGSLIEYLLLSLLLDCLHGSSACDQVDIIFFIDTDTVIARSDVLIEFITSIIQSGSSEHTGFSAIIYGNNIPWTNPMPLVTFYDTQTKLRRKNKKRKMIGKLRNEFKNIKSVQKKRQRTKYIALRPALKIANNQKHPKHADNQQIYIIFDHKNKLLTNPNHVDICKLFEYLNNNQIENENEAPYFMFGQRYSKRNIRDILCKGEKPYYMKENTFFRLNDKFVINKQKMESIYDITCPAMIKAPQYNGNVNVGNHVQYIDLQTVIICNLYYWDHDNDKTTPDELDYKRSYIKVRDCEWFNNDNTFQVYDYLIANIKIFKSLRKKGCRAPVYKIIRIAQNEEIKDCKILRLFVKLPDSPMEYISTANVKGNMLIHQQRNNKRRLIMKELQFDERAIVNGKLNKYMAENIFLEQLAHNIALNRINRVKNVAMKAVKVRKMLNKLRRKYKQKRIKKFTVFGAKTLNEKNMMEFLGVFKKTVNDVKQVANSIDNVAKQVANKEESEKKRKMEASSLQKFIHLKLKKKSTFIKTKRRQKMFGDKGAKGFSVKINGNGEIELKYDLWLTVKLGIYFNFYWKPFKHNLHFEVKLYGKWEIGADFNARFVGKLETLLNNIFNFGTREIIWIGPVPIATLRPYIIISAQMITLPHKVYAGFRCEYKEKFAFGYIYDKRDKIDKSIKERKVLKKNCKKKFGVNGKKNHPNHPSNECPAHDFGFDVKLSVKFGISLYHILNVFLRMELMIPFRLKIPAMLPKSCNAPKGTDMCLYKKHLMAAFSIALNLNIYVAASFHVEKVINSVNRLFNKQSGQMSKAWRKEKKLTWNPIHIIPKIQLECLELDGIFSSLEQQFKLPCCGTPTTLKKGKSIKSSVQPQQKQPVQSQHIYIHILSPQNSYAYNRWQYPQHRMRRNPQILYGDNKKQEIGSNPGNYAHQKYFDLSFHRKQEISSNPGNYAHPKYFDLSFHPKK